MSTTRRSREQFQFTMLELSTLGLSFAATCTLVFFLGFYVGRRAAAEHAPVGESVARVPVGEPPRESEPLRPLSRNQSAEAPPVPARGPLPGRSTSEAPSPGMEAPVEDDAGELGEIPRIAPPGVPYTVQVLATRNRGEAASLVDDLKRKGYGAYVVAVEDAGGSWYRVRIGHFDNPEAAKRMADRASRDLGLTQAYVSPIYSNAR